MKKILTLTQEQFEKFKKSKQKAKVAKELLKIPGSEKVGVGDTAVKISNSKPLEVYKETWKDGDYYYIAIEPMDEEAAFSYSIYPK